MKSFYSMMDFCGWLDDAPTIEWIPCSDERKPDLGVRVLLTSWNEEICVGWLDANEWWHIDDEVVAEGYEPIAWLDCKLPEPYKGGKADV